MIMPVGDMEPQPESGSDKVDDGSSGSSTDLEASADGGSSDRSGGEEEVSLLPPPWCPCIAVLLNGNGSGGEEEPNLRGAG